MFMLIVDTRRLDGMKRMQAAAAFLFVLGKHSLEAEI